MDHVTLTYKGLIIGRLNSACSLSLKTAGKYCEADIELSYVRLRCWRWTTSSRLLSRKALYARLR